MFETPIDVEYGTLNAAPLPLVVKPSDANSRIDMDAVVQWLSDQEEALTDKLYRHGALLFRGFPVATADDFSRFVQVFKGAVLDYVGGAVPRKRINSIVFTSTELTRLRRIRMHNELAYQRDYPDFIFFYCHLPAQQGGETPIVDCRSIYEALDPQVRNKFVHKGVKYVRTFQDKRALRELLKKLVVIYQHLTWQGAFKVQTREEAENLCRERGMEYTWRRNGDLSVSNVFPAVIRHPVTGQPSWFNQAMLQHFNRRSWSWPIYLFRRALYRDLSGLPYQAYYGDGSAISKKEIYHVIDVTYRQTVQFAWRAGDVLLLDNRLVAHGRNSYKGPRKVYVAMLKKSSAAVR